jgi:hypothetical protein
MLIQNYNNITEEIMDVTNRILSQNYFQFSNDYCKKVELAMGAPTFEILAEIFFQFLEYSGMYYIFKNCKIIGYVKYIDDILIIHNPTTVYCRKRSK